MEVLHISDINRRRSAAAVYWCRRFLLGIYPAMHDFSSAAPPAGSVPRILMVTPLLAALSNSASLAGKSPASRKRMLFFHSRSTTSASMAPRSPARYCFVTVMQAARLSCMADLAASCSLSRATASTFSERRRSSSASCSSLRLSSASCSSARCSSVTLAAVRCSPCRRGASRPPAGRPAPLEAPPGIAGRC